MTDLFPTWTLGDLLLTSYPFAVEFDGDHGAPETISELVTSMLADGDLVQQTRHGNREISIVVQVEGPTLGVLAQNEATLRAECSKARNLLTFQPGDVDSPASVFEVLMVSMTQPRNDTHEAHLMRRWELTLTCAPFARSAELTTSAALPVESGSPTVIDTCDSATGWTSTFNGNPHVVDANWLGVSGRIYTYDLFSPGPQTLTLTRTGTFSVATTPYIRVEVFANEPAQTTASAVVDGLPKSLNLISSRKISADAKNYEFVFAVPAGSSSVSSITFSNYSTADSSSFGIAEVSRTGAPPGVSARQLSRVIEVGGTERTPGSLHAYVESGYLGNTLLHTTPYMGTGYSPDLQRWRISGNGTSANVSTRKITGTWEAMQPQSIVARVPAAQLPRGDYILVAAVKSSAIGERSVSWAVKSMLDSSVVGNTTGVATYAFEVADRLEYVPLGVVAAPVVRDEGRLNVEVHLSNPDPGSTTMHVEEWWMFTDGPDSALSIVGTDEANLYIESADITSAVPRYWVGTGDTRFHPNGRLLAQGLHTFPPGLMQVTTISDANDNLDVDLSYYKRWHSNAAE